MNKHTIVTFLVLGCLLGLTAFAHAHNMFNFPYYENDEGTYLSQAWSFVETGKLAPYTYWYDHAPLGWLFMGLWARLTGGFFTFGASVNTGRVFMLVLHVLSAGLLFFIAHKISKSIVPPVISVLLFALSPLGLYFQRRILLDNIMVFWVLCALAVLYKDRVKLTTIAMSAVLFGIAVLTKENAIFFLPAFLYVVWVRISAHQRVVALIQWFMITVCVISFYFLFAFLKHELFPSGWFGDTSSHVSLLGTLHDQFVRGTPYAFWDTRSDFYVNFLEWLSKDTFTIIAGAIATVFSILLAIWVPELRVPALFSVLFWMFLMRGKLVIDFYIVPLIPFIALTFGVFMDWVFRQVFRRRVYPFFAALSICTVILFFAMGKTDHFTRNETKAQVETIEWLKKNAPANAHIIIDNAIFVDLRAPRFTGDRVFPNADYAWKAEKDPMILKDKLRETWRSVDYLTVSHELLKKIKEYEFPLSKAALDNSEELISFRDGSISYIDMSKYISTNGDWMAVNKVKSQDNLLVDRSWQYYKDHFIVSYGQVVDPTGSVTTSEGQSYAMLRAVWQNDRKAFDGAWKWTRDHLQFRGTDHLFSWKWQGDRVVDSESASDADIDIALSLLFAYVQWGDQSYLTDARAIIADVWKHEVVTIGNTHYLKSGTDNGDGVKYRINPSYCSPASFRIFADVDNNDWKGLADDCYVLIDQIANMPKNSTHLPPNWIDIDAKTGIPRLSNISQDDRSYGFDAFRLFWRLKLDYDWFGSVSAHKFLSVVAPFFMTELDKKGVRAVYGLDGEATVPYESLSTYAGAIAVLDVVSPETGNRAYEKYFVKQFNFDEGYWGDKANYYDQNWAWFAVAQHMGRLPNMWKSH